MDDLQDVLEDRLDEVQQQARESEAKTLDTLGALDSKIDKLTHVQEQQTKMHTAQFMDLQEGTTKARGKIHEFERDIERLRVECRTAIHQLRQELDGSFRNEMEKIKDNELASITHQLSEIESGKNKKLTVSMRTMLEASVQEIRQEFGQRIEEENNLLKSEILDQAVRIIRICDGTCAELNHSLQGLEEKLKGLTKDAEGKSAGMTEALEKRIESEIKELDTNIRELDTKLTSLDNVVQHHARRREKLESVKKEMEEQGNELAVQKSTLEAQQIATQQLLQGVQEIRLAKEKGDSQIQAIWSKSDQNIDRLRSKVGVLEGNGDLLRIQSARMAKYLEDPV
jgi:chromosome segregation ATPase